MGVVFLNSLLLLLLLPTVQSLIEIDMGIDITYSNHFNSLITQLRAERRHTVDMSPL